MFKIYILDRIPEMVYELLLINKLIFNLYVNGSIECINLFTTYYPNLTSKNILNAFNGALTGGHLNLAISMYNCLEQKYHNILFISLDYIMIKSNDNSIECIEWLLAKIINKHSISWCTLLNIACDNGNYKCIKYILDNYPFEFNTFIINQFNVLCKNNYIECVKLFLKIYKMETQYINGGLKRACRNNAFDCINLLLDNGAGYCDNCHKWYKNHKRYICY